MKLRARGEPSSSGSIGRRFRRKKRQRTGRTVIHGSGPDGILPAPAALTIAGPRGGSMHPVRRVQLLAVAVVLSAALPARAQTWNLVWSDEFNGAAGTFPDTTKWNYDVGNNNGWGNGE